MDHQTPFAKFTNPNLPAEIAPAPSIEKLANAFELDVSDIDNSNHRPRYCDSGGVNYVYVCASLEAVQRANLNLGAYHQLRLSDTVGVYLYSNGGIDPDTSYHSRMFAPNAGIAEDPATGSAAAGFPAQLLAADALKDGAQSLKIEQGYEMSRPSQIDLDIKTKNQTLQSIRIGGHAEQVMTGHISI